MHEVKFVTRSAHSVRLLSSVPYAYTTATRCAALCLLLLYKLCVPSATTVLYYSGWWGKFGQHVVSIIEREKMIEHG